ncbi:MAG: hydrogenase iron-sulfur subunit [Rhodocyclaceae bacterium]|nr:hydrogenase iron-sulfur subunit [Rhodocyclaceae bacterium]
MYAVTRKLAGQVFQRMEGHLDVVFGHAANPIRHMGALVFFFFWILAATGTYLFIVVDTGVVVSYQSIAALTGWSFGGVTRSLHRYASDAFLLFAVLHLLREWALDRYSGFRWYSWVTGVPLLWLMFASGIGGYWLPWDRLAQYSAVATAEWIDWLPIFAEPIARNFQSPDAVTDRLFTLLVFLHIGFPLFTILGAWAHVHRISRVDHFPSRALALGGGGSLLLLALLRPATSSSPADMTQAVASVPLDWFVLFIHPLTEHFGAGLMWLTLLGLTVLLLALPWLDRRARVPVAVVDPPNCNGCRRCYDDCPYGAVMMLPHPDKARREIAVVDADYCASCGICVGACPSSTPFRRQEQLVTGIDLPASPINQWRERLESWLALPAPAIPRIVVFGCDRAVPLAALAAEATLPLSLTCVAMLPPAFVDYALRSGADGVLVTGCRPGSCHYRLGSVWTEARLSGARPPELRSEVARERLQIFWADAHEAHSLRTALEQFREHLQDLPLSSVTPAFRRRSNIHVHQSV